MKKIKLLIIVPLVCAAIWLLSFSVYRNRDPYMNWTTYAGTNEGNRYSANSQINTKNVNKLKVAWIFDSGDTTKLGQLPYNPIIIDGVMFGVTLKMNLFAVDAATGKQLWLFEPTDKDARGQIRGVSCWRDEKSGEKRIFYSIGAILYCINAEDGTLNKDFGKNGWIDLRQELDGDYSKAYLSANVPGIVYKDMLIIGMRVSEGTDAAPGHIRAFDVRTGKRRWIFHTIPRPGEFGYDTWQDPEAWRRVGGANCWAGMALDEKRGIIYVPTGSATPDFYGGNRKGSNLFANSILALDAATGKYIWHYQVVHHDLWDRDLPANPNLITVKHDGKNIDAIAQITKHGYIFLLDRTNGKPIFPIPEVPVPKSDLPGEESWPTQPVPTLPEPFARIKLDSSEISDRTPEIHRDMVAMFKKLRSGNMFVPPSKQGGFIFPGFDGGGEWGGAAVDIETKILYVNASELPWWTGMIDNPALSSAKITTVKELGRSLYNTHCIACHGKDMMGNGSTIPSLVQLNKRMNESQLRKIIDNGRNMMPAVKSVSETEKAAIANFLLDLQEKEITGDRPATAADKRNVVPYVNTGYNRFYDAEGYPGIKPPWGTLNAVNLNTGKLLWKVPLGEFPELTKRGMPITGVPNYGGPVVTKGGLVFIGATRDSKLRAFDKTDGRLLWETELPAGGIATPAMYTIKGKQFLVIACGGGRGGKIGNKYVAYSLP